MYREREREVYMWFIIKKRKKGRQGKKSKNDRKNEDIPCRKV